MSRRVENVALPTAFDITAGGFLSCHLAPGTCQTSRTGRAERARPALPCSNIGAVGTIDNFGYSPGSITLFFAPIVHANPEKALSKGCAVNVSPGVTATVRKARTNRMRLNGTDIQLHAAINVLEALAPEPVDVQFETVLPLGCGFGVSAACCLSAAFGVSKCFDLGLTRKEIGLVCHAAEVAQRTGIGDIASQLTGGVVLRECISGPLDSRRIDVDTTDRLTATVFGPIATSEILDDTELLGRIVREGDRAMDWIRRCSETTLEEILDRSLLFAKNTGLLDNSKKTQSSIDDVIRDGGHATMVMLGEGLISIAGDDYGNETLDLEIDSDGAR